MEATAYGDVDPDLCSRGLLVTWRFAAADKRGPLTVHWYDGGLMPPTPPGIDPDDPKQRLGEDADGVLFVGETRLHHLRGLVGDAAPAPARAAPHLRAPGEDAPSRRRATTPTGCRRARAGRPACSHFGYGARLTEFMLLGNVALRTGRRLRWDAASMRATNAPEADRSLRQPYRSGWELPV